MSIGVVTDGEFKGDMATRQLTLVPPDPTQCYTTGVRTVSGIDTVTFTRL
ncbi:MAG: hypothetical protein RMX96_19460 [Nostoc sp. ChiSLP02]|nr:hypothetical protein [Nostoc sp. DedSLP05]MDZ8098098.1 hypothetical protein [Nostoc sp. DedSLP01]MDZ8187012.1 hypothetical protein [Nostoc sp. ChiSLP02]